MATLQDVKNNPQISEFIKQTEKSLTALAYTDHGLRHSNLVSERALQIAKAIGCSKREGELSAIGAFCHDMGNYLSRSLHNYLGAVLFHQVFNDQFNPAEMATITQAISSHDKEDLNFANPVSAIVVLADKSDVHRSRVVETNMEEIKKDIHDRVNYATTESKIKIDKNKKRITFHLKIDTNFCSIMEYFKIFIERMIFCRKAAEFLGYKFGLVINKTRLL
jgi:metal-dependent HD superfamily phosphatase/phosphodiesterase